MDRKLIFPLVVFIALVTLPYLAAAWTAGPGYHFGGLLFNVHDGNSYLAKMYEGFRGEWKFTLPYTSEPGSGAYLFLFYIFLGHLARWTAIPAVLVFHLARLFSAVVLALVLYALVVHQQGRKAGWVWGYLLVLLGSGCGWLLSLSGQLGADLWVAEAYPFLSAYATPHFALGLALLAAIFLVASSRPGLPGLALVAFLSLALSIVAPFGVVVAAAVLAALSALSAWALVWRLRQSRVGETSSDPAPIGHNMLPAAFPVLAVVLLGGVPFLLYQYLAIQSDPQLSAWNAQNLTPSLDPSSVVAALSPALVAGIIWLALAWRARIESGRLFAAWLVTGLLLIYVPFDLQRRFMMGLFIPAACLAGAGITALVGKSLRQANLWGSALVLFSIPTNLLILVSTAHGIASRDPLVFLSSDEAQALEWLELNTAPDDLVLASPEMGMFIPAHTGRRVIYGHPFETLNAAAEKQAVVSFFSAAVQMDRQAFLAQRQVDYVFVGTRELSYQPPSLPDALQAVYSGGQVDIYLVPDLSD